MSENNESTVSNDNGVTYTASLTHSAWIKGVVWSIGLGCEVSVIGHSSNQQEDVWLVSRDIDGDGSPDTAISRAGSDLAPVFRVNDVVRLLVQRSSDTAPEMTYGLIVSRSARGVYVHTGLTMFHNSGAVLIDWENARERFLGGEEFVVQHNADATLLQLLHHSAQQLGEQRTEALRDVEREQRRMDEFKNEVALKMKALAVQHEWCGVAREGLEDLGIDWPTTRWSVPVTFTGYVYINADSSDEAERRAQYIIDNIDVSYSSDEDHENFEPGSDWEKEVGTAEGTDD